MEIDAKSEFYFYLKLIEDEVEKGTPKDARNVIRQLLTICKQLLETEKENKILWANLTKSVRKRLTTQLKKV